MRDQFDSKGRMIFPIAATIRIPKTVASRKGGEVVVAEAFCAHGHSLISSVRIDGAPGIHLIYASQDGNRKTDVVISAVVGKCMKKILKGAALKQDEVVRILCPTCFIELPILFDCECGAPIYLFYLDRRLNHSYGQSFCSRIGCTKASRLRFSQDMLNEFIENHEF